MSKENKVFQSETVSRYLTLLGIKNGSYCKSRNNHLLQEI